MTLLSSVLLGVVQGVTEFLPVSSSGHLAIAEHLLGISGASEVPAFFDVLLHLGTLIAIFVYYWRDIVDLVKEFIYLVKVMVSPEERRNLDRLSPDARMILMIIIATLPLLVVYPIKDKVEGLYGNAVFVGLALMVTGCILFFSDRMSRRGRKTAKSATMLDALLVGVGQAFAVVPGISRSGTTISAGMLRGFKRRFAVRFSFLMSIPAVLGANIVSIGDAVAEGVEPSALPAYIIGTIIAAVSGYFAIRLVNLLADKGKFGAFSWYCWIGGVVSLVAGFIIK